ncbi:hypothetical protein PAHAL_4G044900 [Panicum hallii]|uniref:Uncharacterized protein n=1 Tax=Panicum hallii TaxID=206008 RepID=A0A2T8JBS7_9POAL|nr:hypothetical protein PAHAL_4G044900 [Panicum hallii]
MRWGLRAAERVQRGAWTEAMEPWTTCLELWAAAAVVVSGVVVVVVVPCRVLPCGRAELQRRSWRRWQGGSIGSYQLAGFSQRFHSDSGVRVY